jgi:hypothetical protein
MKSTERHKLQHNALADWIGKAITWAKPYRTPILLASLLVLFGLAAYYGWERMSSTSSKTAWTQVNTALLTGKVDDLSHVITEHPRTNAAYTAALLLGDSHLKKGCDDMFINKVIANPELSQAIDNYTIALEGSRISAVRERATFGLAQAREAKRELEQATELYTQITKQWPDGAFAEAAARRLEYLQQPSTKAFFDRFAQFNPGPALSGEPAAGGAKSGSGLDSIPSEPPTSPPTSVKDLKLEGGKGTQPAPAAKK